MKGFAALAALAAAAAAAYYIFVPSTPRPGSNVTPTGPAPGGMPPGIPPEAELIEYAGHDIYVWEVLGPEPDLAFEEWRWVVVDPQGVSAQSGVTSLEGLAGAAAAQAAAKAWVDTKYVPDDSSGGGAGGAGSP